MDMASGRVYFWESDSDEVAWEPPPGAKPRSKQDNAVTFAEHTAAETPMTSTAPAETAVSVGAAGTAPPTAKDTMAGNNPGASAGHTPGGDAADGVYHKQQARTSEGSSEQAERLSSEEREDGQLAEVGSADALASAAAGAGVFAVPDTQVGVFGQQICDHLRSVTQTLCCNVPQLVRLAIEAEARMQDWQMFSSKQQRAVDKCLPQEALSWTDVQDHMQWRWQSIQAAVPGALTEAKQLQQRMEQELEDGEMPPLPSDEAMPSGQAATSGAPPLSSGMPALPEDNGPAVSEQGNALAAAPKDPVAIDLHAGPPAIDLDIEPSEVPPLPAEDPAAAAATSASRATDQTAAAATPSHAAAHGEAVPAADDEADMELDMDVDSEINPAASVSRPASADAAGPGSVSTSASLPNWAGYYMAHGYTYPYYGEPA